MNFRNGHLLIVMASGLLLGILGVLLTVWGNPENSGVCVSCFIENSAGALGMHDNPRMQYLRPELIGFVLGAFATAAFSREFSSRGGSAPLIRFASGIFLIVGCAVFIGCPIKLFLRLSAGDLTALAGVVGLVAGVWGGLKGLAYGVELGAARPQKGGGGFLTPLLFGFFLILLIARPGFVLFSDRGSAAQAAPWMTALVAGLLLGAIAQRSRFCITGSVRDVFLMGKRTPLVWGLLLFFLSAVIMNFSTGRFHPGLYGQPGSHLDFIWSFLGMGLVGWISVIIGGCPFRQLVKSGEGDVDAALVVAGMFVGGGIVQSWGLAASAAGVPLYGKAAVLVGFLFVFVNSLLFRERESV